MNKVLTTLAMLLAGASLFAQSPLDVKETELSNGMKVWVNVDRSRPVVYGAVVVGAGAIDCPDEGIAHYFEHIMFKGTDKIGTVDYDAEKVYLDSIALAYSRLGETTVPEERAEIQREINRLNIAASEFAIPNEFTTLISLYGGTGLNAGTSYDYTVYYNSFSAGYLPQWAELNSERMITPVFRLFQGELETVYEEKNRSADNPLTAPMEKAIAAFAGPDSPYAYPVIGSTENLKNPNLRRMQEFYDKYYVANNMGLILCGDVDTDGLEALLERTFGRIRRGEKPERPGVTAPFNGTRDEKILIKIPIIKGEALAFNGPVAGDPDEMKLAVVNSLLSNGTTGYLDSLMNSHKLLAAAGAALSFNKMGGNILLIIPNVPFGSVGKAEKRVLKEVRRIKSGDFTDNALALAKRDIQKQLELALEDIDSRGEVMMTAMSQGRSWSDYLDGVKAVETMTREDVIEIARKYYDESNMLRLSKKYGSYPKDNVEKPDYEPVIPPHAGEQSEYAKALAASLKDRPEPRFVSRDDVTRMPLGEFSTLYYVPNEVNKYFSLELDCFVGTAKDRRLELAAPYVSKLGTADMDYQTFAREFQSLGAEFSVEAGRNTTAISLKGPEENLEASLRLLRKWIDGVKADKKEFKSVKSDYSLEATQFASGGTQEIFSAMMSRVLYGENSPLLHRLDKKALKALDADSLLDAFKGVFAADCAIEYSGAKPVEEVAALVKEILPLDRSSRHESLVIDKKMVYDEPVVYLYDLPGSRQTMAAAYISVPSVESDADKARLQLFGEYFGGGMSSVLFQEIREFRSFAYSSGGVTRLPEKGVEGDPGVFLGYLGTQADKADAAIFVMDSLLRNMPVRAESAITGRQNAINEINNSYPSFRQLPSAVATFDRRDYAEDPSKPIYTNIKDLTMDDIVSYYEATVKPRPIVWFVVGDKKTLDLDHLSTLGPIVQWKEEDIYKK